MFGKFILSLTAMLLTAGSAQAAPAMWKISDEDSAIWLFGSVHLLPSWTEWRSQHLDKVMSKVDRVYFETDISAEAQMGIAELSYELGFSRDGRLLSERIGPELTDALREQADAHGIPMPLLLTMEPWMAASTITVGIVSTYGYDPNLGVEMVLNQDLPGERKGFLETPEQQLRFLAGGDEEEQIAMLRATLDSMDDAAADLDTMIDAWISGEPELLGEVFDAQMSGFGAGTVERLIDVRNHDWVEQIEAMLARNETALLVVGAAHLAGNVSVVKLLEERGFTSERVQ